MEAGDVTGVYALKEQHTHVVTSEPCAAAVTPVHMCGIDVIQVAGAHEPGRKTGEDRSPV